MCPVSVPWKEDQSCTQCFASEHCGGGGERGRERERELAVCAHDKGSEAFILGNVQNIYDFTFPAKAILFFWHVLINMQNILKI